MVNHQHDLPAGNLLHSYGKWPSYSWFTLKWWFSIVMLVYQRVSSIIIHHLSELHGGFHRAIPLSLDGWFHGKTENHMDDLYSDYRGTPISGNLRSSWRFINGIFTELIQLGFVWNVWTPLQWLYNCCFSFGENHKPTNGFGIWSIHVEQSSAWLKGYPGYPRLMIWFVHIPGGRLTFPISMPYVPIFGANWSLQESTENTATLW